MISLPLGFWTQASDCHRFNIHRLPTGPAKALCRGSRATVTAFDNYHLPAAICTLRYLCFTATATLPHTSCHCMLSVTDQRALHGLARAFAADQEKQRGGKAANSKRKAAHCKLLELWSRSLVNLCDVIFSCQPARHPVFAAKFIQVEGRRRQLAQPGFVVHRGTPLLPATSTEDSESEASVLEAPVDLEDLEALALEEAEPVGESGVAEPSASSSSAPVGSLERRSRSPQRSSRADNRDLGSDARGLDSFGRLSSGRPLPPALLDLQAQAQRHCKRPGQSRRHRALHRCRSLVHQLLCKRPGQSRRSIHQLSSLHICCTRRRGRTKRSLDPRLEGQ